MADENKKGKTVNEKNPSKFSKVLNWFKRLPKLIAKPFKHMWHELRLVSWPTKNELIRNSVVVLAFIVLMSVVVGLLDLGATNLVTLIIS